MFENKPFRRTAQNTDRNEAKKSQGVDQFLYFFYKEEGGGLGFRSHIYPTVQPLSTQGLGRGKRFDYFITTVAGERGGGGGEVDYKLTYTWDWSLLTI